MFGRLPGRTGSIFSIITFFNKLCPNAGIPSMGLFNDVKNILANKCEESYSSFQSREHNSMGGNVLAFHMQKIKSLLKLFGGRNFLPRKKSMLSHSLNTKI